MPEKMRVTGLPSGAADTGRDEVQFTLQTERGTFECVATLGVAQQIMSALARMCSVLRAALHQRRGVQVVAAEPVAAANIQTERYEGTVLLELTTTQGIPFLFSLSKAAAADIAARLKTESERPHQSGRA